jgi:FtsH-binding integral membrane protein
MNELQFLIAVYGALTLSFGFTAFLAWRGAQLSWRQQQRVLALGFGSVALFFAGWLAFNYVILLQTLLTSQSS